MIIAIDVDYRNQQAVAAGVQFRDWQDKEPANETTVTIAEIAPYEPGQFYRRELPCIIQLLDALPAEPRLIIVDGYVKLGNEDKPGLGAHLFEALDHQIPVIGVAKNYFHGTPDCAQVLRGDSQKPLYVTSAGIEPVVARRWIADMHGPYRIPTLLKRVDALCRGQA